MINGTIRLEIAEVREGLLCEFARYAYELDFQKLATTDFMIEDRYSLSGTFMLSQVRVSI